MQKHWPLITLCIILSQSYLYSYNKLILLNNKFLIKIRKELFSLKSSIRNFHQFPDEATSMQRNIYKSVTVFSPSLQKKVSFLVKEKDESLIQNTIEKSDNIDEVLKEYIDNGLVFPSSSEGTRSIYLKEAKSIDTIKTSKKPKRRVFAADFYFNNGTEENPVYIKTSKYTPTKYDKLENLEDKGIAFTNTSKLFNFEHVLNRADSIATKLKSEFPITSPEWRKWTEKTNIYNATSLTQVFADYFSENSIGDVGGKDVQYVPKRGFPGTLAPGELFKEDCPFDSLDHKVLHPWPAMQQFQWHVRWPPSHPMIPPPLLWFGLNNMYTENFTNWELSLPSNETVGGLLMEPRDAMRIAKYSRFGNCYEPSEQIPHGGMIFPSGHKIPNYNPDHGPTVSEEEATPPIPEFLKPITETWLDPFFGVDGITVKQPKAVSEEEGKEIADELEMRKQAAERVLNSQTKALWQVIEEEEDRIVEKEVDEKIAVEVAAFEKERKEIEFAMNENIDNNNTTVSDSVAGYLLMNSNVPGEFISDELNQTESYSGDYTSPLYLNERKTKIRNQIKESKRLKDIADGKARGTRSLITYNIETMRNMTIDIQNAGRDFVSVKKSTRRRQRKKTTAGDIADDDSFIETSSESFEGDFSGGDNSDPF